MASPGWAARHRPAHPDAAARAWVLYGEVAHADRWTFERGDQRVTVRAQPALVTDDTAVIVQAVRAGVGVGALPPFLVADDLAAGRLVHICPAWRSVHVLPIWAVRPHRTFVPARVQTVIDAMARHVQQQAPAWVGQGG